MKNNNHQQLYKYLLIGVLMMFAVSIIAQEGAEDKKIDKRPVRKTFNSALILENQSVMVPQKGTFEMDIIHRFGHIENGYDDFFGLFAPSNIKLGFTYSPIDKLNVGLGLTKVNKVLDASIKYNPWHQRRDGIMPVSITYFGNIAVDTRDEAKTNFDQTSHRFSYFHQVIVARKFSKHFSLQIAPSFSHFNQVSGFVNDDNEHEGYFENDHLAIAASGKYRITSTTSVLGAVDYPITQHAEGKSPLTSLSFGIEVTSSAHAFQIFMSHYYGIVPQYNNLYGRNSLFGQEMDSGFMLSFNMTRLWSL